MGAVTVLSVICVSLTLVSLTKAACLSGSQLSIKSEDTAYSSKYPAQNVLLNTEEREQKYWLLPDGAVNAGFVVDLGAEQNIRSLKLTNTHNWAFHDRGTADFEVWFSSDGASYTHIASSTLPDTRRKIPKAHDFPFTGAGRYVKFVAKSYYGRGAGLGYMEVCVEPAVLKGLSIHSEDTPLSADRFSARNTLQVNLPEVPPNRIYWLLPDNVANAGFVVDLGAVKTLSKITLVNTRNAQYHDRGTKDFEISISSDAASFKVIGRGRLLDVRRKRLVFQHFRASGSGRYVKFVAKSFYGKGAGLQFIGLIGA